MKLTAIVVAAVALASIGCEEKPAPSAKPVTPPPAAAPKVQTPPPANVPAPSTVAPGAVSGNAISVMGLSFTLPAGWKGQPPSSPMRLAEAQVPDASGDPAKMCAVTFSTAGGDVASNMARWSGQVTDAQGQPTKADVKVRTVNGMTVHTVELTGAFMNMGETTPHQNWMLRGSVIETPAGMLFIKMTGPAEQMTAAGPAYTALIDGLKK